MKYGSAEYFTKMTEFATRKRVVKSDTETSSTLEQERPTTVPVYKDGKYIGRAAKGEALPKGLSLEQ